jgi:hypothetical protein
LLRHIQNNLHTTTSTTKNQTNKFTNTPNKLPPNNTHRKLTPRQTNTKTTTTNKTNHNTIHITTSPHPCNSQLLPLCTLHQREATGLSPQDGQRCDKKKESSEYRPLNNQDII